MTPHRMKAAQCERDGDGDAVYRRACNDMRAAVRIVSRWRASCGGGCFPSCCWCHCGGRYAC